MLAFKAQTKTAYDNAICCIYLTMMTDISIQANGVDPDQTAPTSGKV